MCNVPDREVVDVLISHKCSFYWTTKTVNYEVQQQNNQCSTFFKKILQKKFFKKKKKERKLTLEAPGSVANRRGSDTARKKKR